MNEVLLYFHQHNGIEALAYIISILGVSVVAWGLYEAYTYHFCYIATLKHSLDLIERKVWKPYWKQKIGASIFCWIWLYFYLNGYFS